MIINRKQSKLKKRKKINKINSEEDNIILHTQFTGFGDDGNELRKRKNQLKLRNNKKKTGNVLIIRSSITKDINTKTLKDNVTVNTNRGGTNYVSQEKC